jgi:hypothetical protein
MAITTEDVLRRDGVVQRSFAMSGAGTETLIADPGDGQRVAIINMLASLDVAGTLALLAGSTDIVAPMPLAGGVPFAFRSNVRSPFLEAKSSEAVSIVTATGKASGVVSFRIVPAA